MTGVSVRAVAGALAAVLVTVAAVVFVLAVGVSRVTLGVHYPSDVVGGLALGLAWATGTVAVVARPLCQIHCGPTAGGCLPHLAAGSTAGVRIADSAIGRTAWRPSSSCTTTTNLVYRDPQLARDLLRPWRSPGFLGQLGGGGTDTGA